MKYQIHEWQKETNNAENQFKFFVFIFISEPKRYFISQIIINIIIELFVLVFFIQNWHIYIAQNDF